MSAAALAPPREGSETARLLRSVRALSGSGPDTDRVAPWLAEYARTHRFRVDRIPFADLDGWSFAPDTGNLVHRSGRFFSVEGLHVTHPEGPFPEWQQPIINQPEVGVLGILVKEFDGVPHFLMQAKMEPGNPNLLQLSPTVQATRSNYTKVHRGADVKYLEYFVDAPPERVIADVLQSEHGSWFLRKANRNMLVEAVGEVPLEDNFCWLTLGQIGELLRHDNVVNMDARTVLACAPTQPATGALHSERELLSWITGERAHHDRRVRSVPLASLAGWERGAWSVERVPEERHFRVMAVSVEAENREVAQWTQPLIEPIGLGVTAFVTRTFGGVPHLLAHARVEGGLMDTLELAPTVQCTPDAFRSAAPAQRPPFLDLVLDAPKQRIRYEAVHAEEGGRFYHAQSRYLIVEADESEAPAVPPPGYRWVTPAQLNSLVRHSRYVNVQARSLLACLNTAAVTP
ncbi:NDP-hexose 2,3-dehydratase family protein [Streptomyces sp. LHD-70]|uniref:NDP-hexose 2,3-dehydratase family protein n=1 Tax=Streptomyces sp. LHD-70 TaxID=3072140 RepID=UPI00280EBAA4|nr:NDP-hexose 2,3-dehydratase family protein [Streptomyces sp. LHD-70]MDQ8707290.1 NDP-hexose 2,3-dehydratase family protein [Streptomyces sp. LHD-70]